MMSLLMLLEAVLVPSYLIELPKHSPLGFRLVGEEFPAPYYPRIPASANVGLSSPVAHRIDGPTKLIRG